MIDEAFKFIATHVDAYLKGQADSDGQADDTTSKNVATFNVARLGDPKDDLSGKPLVALTLVNIEEERAAREPQGFRRGDSNQIIYQNPPVPLNLYGLFTATIDYNKDKGPLRLIAQVIQCFQAERLFTPQTHPALDPSIERLSAELVTLNFEQINHLWSTLGGKYLPSVLYKFRLVRIADPIPRAVGDTVLDIEVRDRSHIVT